MRRGGDQVLGQFSKLLGHGRVVLGRRPGRGEGQVGEGIGNDGFLLAHWRRRRCIIVSLAQESVQAFVVVVAVVEPGRAADRQGIKSRQVSLVLMVSHHWSRRRGGLETASEWDRAVTILARRGLDVIGSPTVAAHGRLGRLRIDMVRGSSITSWRFGNPFRRLGTG